MLTVGQTGSYAELSKLKNPDNLDFLYIPGISALLVRAEELKGEPLTEKQKLNIRNNSQVVVTPTEVAQATIQDRGYE